MAWLSDWKYRRKITVDNTNIDSDLTHFPVPIFLGSSVGQSSQDVTDIFDEVGANWQKIAVTKSDGDTQIYVEKEDWDDTNETAVLWVSKDDLTLSSSSDTELYIYYDNSKSDNTDYVGDIGNRTEVWNSDYKAVYHMKDTTDSTSNNYDATNNGASQTTGKVDGAYDFDGNDDYMELNDPLNFGSDSFSIATTVKFDSLPTQWFIGNYDESKYYTLKLTNTGILAFDIDDDVGAFTRVESSFEPETGKYYRIYAVRDSGNNLKLYIDGIEEDSTSDNGNNIDSTNNLRFGEGNSYATDEEYFLDGIMDETQIISGAMSESWIKADYYSTDDNLLSFGSQETENAAPDAPTNPSPSDGATDIATDTTLSVDVSDPDGDSMDVSFYWDDDTLIEEVTGVSSGSTAETSALDLDNDTTYNWYAVADDGSETTRSSNAWDISKASFKQSIDTQDAIPEGIFFKPDGTKMYEVGGYDEKIYEYDLSTAWDISTASFSQSIDSQDGSPKGIFFKDDGTKMYEIGSNGDKIYESDLSTAWDISTASFSQSIDSQDGIPQGIFFKDDGTKMYEVGSYDDKIYESDLSTAWDISTASFNQSIDTQDSVPEGIFFKSDGTKMYEIGSNGDKIYESDLSTAWDISTASFNQSIDTQDGTPTGIFFKDDGTKMYEIGSSGDKIYEYDISASWNFTTEQVTVTSKPLFAFGGI